MEVKDILSIAAIIIAPVIAVLIGQWLQMRAENRKDKCKYSKYS